MNGAVSALDGQLHQIFNVFSVGHLVAEGIVYDIDRNYPLVTNIVAPANNHPPGYPDYTIYHYFTVFGYDPVDRTVTIADPANFGGNQIYWISFDQLASLINIEKSAQSTAPIPTTVLQCRDFVGHALQDVVDGKLQENDYYSIFIADQKALTAEAWAIVKPEHSKLQEKLRRFSVLDEFLEVQPRDDYWLGALVQRLGLGGRESLPGTAGLDLQR